jgi:hypothetical protein
MIRELQNPTGVTRFGYGLYPPAQQVRAEARAYFLEVLRKVCPEVTYSLRNELLPMYERWAASQSHGTPSLPSGFLDLQQQQPDIADAVMGWCEKSYLIGRVDPEPAWHGQDWQRVAHISSLWPAIQIHETMLAWSRPVGSRWLESDPPQWPQTIRFLGHIDIGGPRTIIVPLPNLEDYRGETQYVRHATAVFERLLREALTKERLAAKQREKAQGACIGRAIKTQMAHFDWVALRQARGWGIPAIAKWHEARSEPIEIDAIRKGMKSLAGWIGLRLRAGRPGRPRKPGDPSA